MRNFSVCVVHFQYWDCGDDDDGDNDDDKEYDDIKAVIWK